MDNNKVSEINDLMAAGDRAYLTKDLDQAAEKYSLATELSVDAYGDFAPECFEPFFKYGRALAGLAQMEDENPQVEFKSVQNYLIKMAGGLTEMNTLALDDSRIEDPEDLPEEERNEIINEVDNALEENAQELDDLAKKSKQPAEEVKAEEEAAPELPDTEEKTTPAAATEGEEVVKDDAEVEAPEDVDTEEDDAEEDLPSIVLAYENLEVARKIAEKNGESKEWDLKRAEVLSIIGELYLKEDKYAEAIADLQTALELNQKHLDANDRIIASSYYELALAHNLNDDYLRASELAAKTMEILSFCVEQAKTAAEDAEKIAELEECLEAVTAAHEDYVSSHKDAQMKKAEEAKEAAKVSPEKSENVEPATDITANIRKGKRPAEEVKETEDGAPKKHKAEEVPVDPAV